MMAVDGRGRRFVQMTVVREGLAITWHNLFRFLGIVVAVAIPVAVLTALARLLLLSGITPGPGGTIDISGNGAALLFLLVASLLTLLAFLVTQAAVVAATLQVLRGGPVVIGASLSQALSALPRLIPAGMLLFMGGGALAGVIGFFIVRIFGAAPDGAAGNPQNAQTALGLFSIVVIVIAFTILTLVWVFVPAIMAERAGPIASFKRSFALTKGRRWSIAGIVVVLSLTNLLASLLTRFLMANGAPYGGFALSLIAGLFLLVLGAALSAVGYAHLRAEKEGSAAVDPRTFD